jgi:ABC-type dipeptide/oligopeptide/nickel transport system permease component
MGVVTITALLTIFANFVADVAYVVVDPRIRY